MGLPEMTGLRPRSAALLLLGVGAISSSCSPRVRSVVRAPCPSIHVWTFPETLEVDTTAFDNRSAEVRHTQARIDAVAIAALLHCARFGALPLSIDELLAAPALPRERATCAISNDLLLDAWDRPMRYERLSTGLAIWSAGPDGRFGTSDDIGLPTAGALHSEPLDLDRACTRRPSVIP